ncbi:hypothetical protein F5Y18DRAFT_94422 [Xylariaceae sp. FL1019]|nr:hypothetical protein F5Y18DRAFT_94422 [Xylariaceae sp. FL1019]
MTLEDWLDELCVRFIINLPREDLSSVARICFQIEEAQWFYEDFIRPLDPTLPSMSLRTFSLKMFQHCPLLASFSADIHIKAFDEFMQYKTRVPVRGAVMLNEAMDAAVLVRGYKKGASWSFPRGKINKNEDDLDCAVREVYEETGYDLRAAGLVEKNAPVHPLEVTMHDQQVRLYVFRGVPEDTVFETRTRKEIGAIKWYKVSELPAYRKKKVAKGQDQQPSSSDRFYMVAPFMVHLKQWVLKQQKLDVQNAPAHLGHDHPVAYYDENGTDDNMLHEPPVTEASTQPEIFESATKELHRLLKIKPPTQGLQLPSPSPLSEQPTGQSLMSILQPSVPQSQAATGQSQRYVQPQTPHDQEVTAAPQPHAPHPHHPAQLQPLSNYSTPPAFPIVPGASNTNYQAQMIQQQAPQQRARPHVFVDHQVHHHIHHTQPYQKQPPAQPLPNPPIQLLHPQPLPPQVQKAMLFRDMASPPNAVNPNLRAGPPTMPQPSQLSGQSLHHQPSGVHHQQPAAKSSTQLPAHSANLLNVLKGSSSAKHPIQGPPSHPLPPLPSPHSHHVAQTTMDGSRHEPDPSVHQDKFALPYRSSLPSTNLPAATMTAPAPFSTTSSRMNAPTDVHRAGLLDIFKQRDSPKVVSNSVGGPTTSSPLSNMQPDKVQSPRHQRPKQDSSAAQVLRNAAEETGKRIQMNPETNLPYGAHSILARPRRQPSGTSAHSPALSRQGSHDSAAYVPLSSRPSPEAFRQQRSPFQAQPRLQGMHSPQRRTPQTDAYSGSSYSYYNQGTMPNPLAQNAPIGTTMPSPGTLKPRTNSTTDQQKSLLAILGSKSHGGMEQSKGKEAMSPTLAGTGLPAPRSRLASFASNDSGRAGAAAISSADRNFLLDFLGHAANNSKN